MATALNFKDIIDLPEWRPLAIAPNSDGTGRGLACDLRNNEDCHPQIFHLASAGILENYDVKSDGWLVIGSPGLTGAFGAGAGSVLAPQRGPRGTIGSGSSTKTVVLSTALPAAVGVNQLSDRGDGRGFKIRIIGNASGSSGKTEERLVVGNTAGLTPAVTLDTPLSFTPTAGCAYEFLSGRVYLLGAGTIASGIWKYYDILTNSFSGNLAVTNLPSPIGTDSNFVCLDELHVPSSQAPGGGYFGNLTATNISSTTLTGRPTGGDATVAANEFRNFQIRIVTDTAKPQAVGQRRKISSHTAGPSPVYTVPAWSVIPSANAVYVVENSGEILLWTSASTTTYTYAQDAIAGGQSADTWSATT